MSENWIPVLNAYFEFKGGGLGQGTAKFPTLQRPEIHLQVKKRGHDVTVTFGSEMWKNLDRVRV